MDEVDGMAGNEDRGGMQVWYPTTCSHVHTPLPSANETLVTFSHVWYSRMCTYQVWPFPGLATCQMLLNCWVFDSIIFNKRKYNAIQYNLMRLYVSFILCSSFKILVVFSFELSLCSPLLICVALHFECVFFSIKKELIQLIKQTKIPIICMCNDRNHTKVRSLSNYCFDLRFQRPRIEQIKVSMKTKYFIHIFLVLTSKVWKYFRVASCNSSF